MVGVAGFALIMSRGNMKVHVILVIAVVGAASINAIYNRYQLVLLQPVLEAADSLDRHISD